MPAQVFIVLFRGVGGATKLPSAPLREALITGGFRNVSTYIATGNVVLTADLPAEAVKQRVTAIARKELGFTKPVMVVSRSQWAALIRKNPFPEAVEEPRTLHAFVLEAKPRANGATALAARAIAGERLAVKGKVLYLHTPRAFGASKLPPLVDRLLGVASTARNWNTVLKLGELAGAAARGQRGT